MSTYIMLHDTAASLSRSPRTTRTSKYLRPLEWTRIQTGMIRDIQAFRRGNTERQGPELDQVAET